MAFDFCVRGWFLMALFSLWAIPWTHSGVQKKLMGICLSCCFLFFSSENGPRFAKECILLLALRCAIDVARKNQYNHTQHHYHTHANILALKRAGHSLKRIVRDGINRILSRSECACRMRLD